MGAGEAWATGRWPADGGTGGSGGGSGCGTAGWVVVCGMVSFGENQVGVPGCEASGTWGAHAGICTGAGQSDLASGSVAGVPGGPGAQAGRPGAPDVGWTGGLVT